MLAIMQNSPTMVIKNNEEANMMSEPEKLYKKWLELKHSYINKNVFSTIIAFIGILYTSISGKQAAIPDTKHIVVNIIVLLVVALIVSYILFTALQEINNLILFIPEDNLPNFEDVVNKIFGEAVWTFIFVIIMIVFVGLISVFILPKNIQNQISQLIYLISFIPLALPFFYGVKSQINIYYKIHPLDYEKINSKGFVAGVIITITAIIVSILLIIFCKNLVTKLIIAFYWLPMFVFLAFFLFGQYFKMRKYISASKQK